ncbi:DUF4167 domain-containing protein [Sphingobium sp. WCS2017Hpa-17]|uniref:DUF4167 domain-containing protein n=1 Tax=Sphingobium sp. WCS2017Hpa-17 TaxID=3073638 RepID=UPI00288BFAB0|nr:DUF4167 domain-containing protein [Sphingobium sp. WCS2017Hpa-17]
MINNRQAGRRNRGRNNNNGRPNGNNRGGGDNGNRIDNRARGNATQLLEKYKNMARDAQMAGDRVNAEYYLQFADHYFRVLADNRARQEEQQQRFRPRDENNFDEDGDDFDTGFDGNDDFRTDAQPQYDRTPREQGQYDRAPRDRSDRQEDSRDGRDQRDNREGRAPRNTDRRDRPRRDRFSADGAAPQQELGVEGPAGNPALDAPQPVAKPKPQLRPRAEAKPEAQPVTAVEPEAGEAEAPRARRGRPRKAAAEEGNEGLDLAVLPPSIARADNDAEPAEDAPKKRTRRPRAATEAAE